MNTAFCRRANFRFFRSPGNFVMCILVAALSLSCSGLAAAGNNATAEINLLEVTLTGQSKAGLPLLTRVDALETLTFGQPSSGGLKDRIARLKQYLSGESSTAGEVRGRTAAGKGPITPGKFQPIAPQTATAKLLSNRSARDTASPGPPLNKDSKTVPAGNSAQKSFSDKTASAKDPAESKSNSQMNPSGSKTENNAAPGAVRDVTAQAESDVPPIKYPPALQKLMVEAIHLYQDGKAEEARVAFEHILSLYPDCVDACYDLGALAEKSGDKETALNYYERAQYLAPGDSEIQASLLRVGGRNLADAANAPGNPPESNRFTEPDPPSTVPPSNAPSPNAPSPNMPPAAGSFARPFLSGAGYGQAIQTAVSAGKSILFYTLNRAGVSIPNF